MTELYALPDHVVIQKLIPGIGARHLAVSVASNIIRQNPGLIPIAIDHRGEGRVFWADIGDHPFHEWQFIFTIKHLAETGAISTAFTTTPDILLDDALFAAGLPPRGLIFHISRCGSTLLAKALARLSHNVVINQGGPLQRGFWALWTKDWRRPLPMDDEAMRMFRNLILAMTRPRHAGQSQSFVKFISWNTLYLDFILKALADTPALFLYRNPVEVIASVRQETTAALVAKTTRQAGLLTGGDADEAAMLSDTAYLARCYAQYFRAALAVKSERIAYLDYVDIKPQSFEMILHQGLHFMPRPDELASMLEQFQFHSKDDTDGSVFSGDAETKRAAISGEDTRLIDSACGRFLSMLRGSERNLFQHANKRACMA
ncbi:MAG: hypothetical protein ACOY99_01320 [Pseudomonadota bacterium]